MTEDIKWANGMEGGYVNGHDGVRKYWTRQFEMISSNVKPLEIKEQNVTVEIEAHQVAHDLDGNLLADEMVEHVCYMKDNKVAEFHINK